MISVSRFRVTGDLGDFVAGATAVVEHFAAAAGSAGAELVQNLDEPELWAIISRWQDVGSYRRAFNGTEAKLILIPLLSMAIDEPSAFDSPAVVGENLPRGTVG